MSSSTTIHAPIKNALLLSDFAGGGVLTIDAFWRWFEAQPMVLAVSQFLEDWTWLYNQTYPFVVLSKIDPQETYLEVNAGGEATAYLAFAAAFYDHLPTLIGMIHGHQLSWHQSLTPLDEILRGICLTDTGDAAGDAYYFTPLNNKVLRTGAGYHQDPMYERMRTTIWNADGSIFLAAGYPQLPKEIQTWCCGQFIIHRDAIRKRPGSFWNAFYKLVTQTDDLKDDVWEERGQWAYYAEYAWGVIWDAEKYQPDETFGLPPLGIHMKMKEWEAIREIDPASTKRPFGYETGCEPIEPVHVL